MFTFCAACIVAFDIWLLITLVLQQNRLRWAYAAKGDDDWVKKCMEYEVEGPRPRGRPKRTWREVVAKDCHACKLNKEDAMDRSKCCPTNSVKALKSGNRKSKVYGRNVKFDLVEEVQ